MSPRNPRHEPEARLRWERGATWVPAVDASDHEVRVSPVLLIACLAALAVAFVLSALTS